MSKQNGILYYHQLKLKITSPVFAMLEFLNSDRELIQTKDHFKIVTREHVENVSRIE